jgi:aconitate hydratase
MVRGTFANIRIRNQMAPGTEGGVTVKLPEGTEMSIFDAAMAYEAEGTPLMIIAGKEYGTGSSRDWAAKGTKLLGVKAVLVESYERIHRANLVGHGRAAAAVPRRRQRRDLRPRRHRDLRHRRTRPLNRGESRRRR